MKKVFYRGIAFLHFLLLFAFEFLKANLNMVYLVLFADQKKCYSGIFYLDTKSLKSFEILLLSHCINLTPGTTLIEIKDDYSHIKVHTFQLETIEKTKEGIMERLVSPILRFSR